MAQPLLLFIGTSKIKEIRAGGEVSYKWGSFGKWTKFKRPAANSAKKVKYNKNTKNAPGAAKYGGVGGVTVLGTSIPATATRTISGVTRTCEVRYYQRGYTIYKRTSALKKKKKMLRKVYTKAKPYQYRLQYKDKPVVDKSYSKYVDGIEYIYFWDYYYVGGVETATTGHLSHPTKFEITYSDVNRNFDSSKANNSDGRDNKGSYVLSNVRPNVVSLDIEWEGISEADGADLLDTLNPVKNKKGENPYLIVQYMDPARNTVVNKTFYAGPRKVVKYPQGHYKSISVTLTEV